MSKSKAYNSYEVSVSETETKTFKFKYFPVNTGFSSHLCMIRLWRTLHGTSYLRAASIKSFASKPDVVTDEIYSGRVQSGSRTHTLLSHVSEGVALEILDALLFLEKITKAEFEYARAWITSNAASVEILYKIDRFKEAADALGVKLSVLQLTQLRKAFTK